MDMKKKQRLVGVFVLVAIAALAVPALFQFASKKPSDNLTQNIPVEPEIPDVEIAETFDDEIDLSGLDDFEMNLDDVKEESPKIAEKEEQKPTVKPKKITAEPVKPKTPVKTAQKPKPKKVTVVKKEKPALKKPENWAVQLGSFSKKQNANKLINQLRKKGLTAYSKESTINHKKITRVFVGPTTDTIKAQEMIKRLDKEFHIKAIVVRHKV